MNILLGIKAAATFFIVAALLMTLILGTALFIAYLADNFGIFAVLSALAGVGAIVYGIMVGVSKSNG